MMLACLPGNTLPAVPRRLPRRRLSRSLLPRPPLLTTCGLAISSPICMAGNSQWIRRWRTPMCARALRPMTPRSPPSRSIPCTSTCLSTRPFGMARNFSNTSTKASHACCARLSSSNSAGTICSAAPARTTTAVRSANSRRARSSTLPTWRSFYRCSVMTPCGTRRCARLAAATAAWHTWSSRIRGMAVPTDQGHGTGHMTCCRRRCCSGDTSGSWAGPRRKLGRACSTSTPSLPRCATS
mmetsp:Transcript_51707/g.110474  ORF Transcript_51707/g.110474 Transcript_51707/m.110474 type:complete len:240 (+) Transcript_51707:501-1220(+)